MFRRSFTNSMNLSKLPTNEMMRVLRKRATEKAYLRAQQHTNSSNPSVDRHTSQLRSLMRNVDGEESPVAAQVAAAAAKAKAKAELRADAAQCDQDDNGDDTVVNPLNGRRVSRRQYEADAARAARAVSPEIQARRKHAQEENDRMQKEEPEDGRVILMEMFKDMKPSIPRGWGMAFPLHRWFGVRCNPGGSMIELNLNRIDLKPKLGGRLDLSMLPRSLRVLDLSDNEFEGEIDFDTLPPFLEELLLGNNRFTCNPAKGFDGACLSNMMSMIDLSANRFVGPAEFSTLPPHLMFLNLSKNKFTNAPGQASVDLAYAPPTLKGLDISKNEFTGPIELTGIPSQMPVLEDFFITHNKFSGRAPPLILQDRLENFEWSAGNDFDPQQN